MEQRDWLSWHDAYADPSSSQARRLAAVQRLLSDALKSLPPGPARLLSVCAGQGLDVIGVLEHHERRADVSALLVELDPRNVERGRALAAEAGLDSVVFACADAGKPDSYGHALPSDVVLVCGVLGNVSDTDIESTITRMPELTAPGATVIWTRHRRHPDATPTVRALFAAAGFEELDFVSDGHFGVGRHRLQGAPRPLNASLRLFRFES